MIIDHRKDALDAEAAMALATEIRAKARALGFDHIGFAPAQISERDQARLEQMIAQGEYGSMGWMANRVEQRRDPKALWQAVRSVLVLGVNYGPGLDPLKLLEAPDRGVISVYARHKDYHDLIKKRLKQLGRWLVAEAGGDIKVFVDTAPVLEKALAAQTVLGWQGKHSNLVSRHFGSWLFLGEIFTTLDLPPDAAEKDHCGRCHSCMTICPTQAITRPYHVEAQRCISYLTIEHDGPIPHEFREALGNHIYGCDDCLAVCPWNKFAQITKEPALRPRAELMAPHLVDFLSLDDPAFRNLFSGSPIKRSGRRRFLRNVLIALGNSGEADAVPAMMPCLTDSEPLIRGAAIWALSRLMSASAFQKLREETASQDDDPTVRTEWERADSLTTTL